MNRAHALLLVAALAVGALTRFENLDRRELWFDEAISVDRAARANGWQISSFADDNKPPLYPLLLRAWISICGTSESAVRGLSATCGVLTILFVWLLAREMLSENGAAVAAWLFALSPLAVHYGREARNYALLMLVLTASCWLLERALGEPRRSRWWLLYAMALGATIFTHYHAGLVISAHAIQVVSRRPVAWKPWLGSVALVGASFVPWCPVLRRQLSGVSNGLAWVEQFWLAYPPLLAVARSLVAYLPGGAVPRFVGMTTIAELQPFVVLTGGLLLAVSLVPRAARWIEPRRGRAVLVLVVAVVTPLAVMWIVSYVATPVYTVGRADSHVLPLFCVLLAAGWERIRARFVRAVVLGALLLFGLATLSVADRGVSDAERRAFMALRGVLVEGDLVICAGHSGPSAAYYFEHRERGNGIHVRHYPENLSLNPRGGDTGAYSDAFLRAESEDTARQAEHTLAQGRRVVILGSRSPANRPLLSAFEQRLELARLPGFDYRISRIEVDVMVFEVRPRR